MNMRRRASFGSFRMSSPDATACATVPTTTVSKTPGAIPSRRPVLLKRYVVRPCWDKSTERKGCWLAQEYVRTCQARRRTVTWLTREASAAWQGRRRVQDFDLIVVGAGSAGVWAAPFAARLGARVGLVEKGRIGGDCTHYGCVPSKALLKAAGVAWHLRTADRFGIDAVQPRLVVDLGRVMAGVRQAIDRVYAFETPEVLAQAGVDVIMGEARFEDPHTLRVGPQTRLRARHFLLCTGARPATPPIPGLDVTPYWNYQTVWRQDRLPRRLLVLGSGPVGTELTQAFGRLGSHVTVFERGDRPLRVADPEASEVLRQVVEEEGVSFRSGAAVNRPP